MMKQKARKWITFTLRWGIAVAGIWWVLAKTPFTDKLTLVRANNTIQRVDVLNDPPEDAPAFQVKNPGGQKTWSVARDAVWTQPDRSSVHIHLDGKNEKVKLLAIRPGGHYSPGEAPAELLVRDPSTGRQLRIAPPPGYTVRVPYPMVDIGIVRLVRFANIGFLLAALLVLPLSYLITSRRWHLLLGALDIRMTQARTFVLNMVGAFYNTFMPGSTGGDLLKAYYASKQTTHGTRAVMSVIVDRAVGLIALIVVGGVMAGLQWDIPACRKVAVGSIAVCVGVLLGLLIFYNPTLHRI